MHAELNDDRLLLRPPQLDDMSQLLEAARESVEEVGRWLPWCHENYGPHDAQAWVEGCLREWRSERSYPFFIFDRQSQQLLGGCGLNEIDPHRRRANLGYWVRSSAMGRGVATAAALLVARFGLEQLEFQRLEIVAAAGNWASQRVAEKLGAVRECLSRNRLRIRNTPVDAYVFGLIPDDLQ